MRFSVCPPREDFTGRARRDCRHRRLESRQRRGESGEHPTTGITPSRILATIALTKVARDRPSMPRLSKGNDRARFTVFTAKRRLYFPALREELALTGPSRRVC
jgi:hypothetical protein